MYEVFKKLVKTHNTSAYQVAKDTGVSQATLSDWKKGRSTPKTETLKKIADYFGVTLDYLTGAEEIKQEINNSAEKEIVSSFLNEYRDNAIILLSKLCKRIRIEKDLTEKTVASSSNISLEKYLLFENEFVDIETEQIIEILSYFELNITYAIGYLTGILIEKKENEAKTLEILNRILEDGDFKSTALERLNEKSQLMLDANVNINSFINDDSVNHLVKVLFNSNLNENDN